MCTAGQGEGNQNINPIICNKGAGVQSFVLICAEVCGEGSTKNPGGSRSSSNCNCNCNCNFIAPTGEQPPYGGTHKGI